MDTRSVRKKTQVSRSWSQRICNETPTAHHHCDSRRESFSILVCTQATARPFAGCTQLVWPSTIHLHFALDSPSPPYLAADRACISKLLALVLVHVQTVAHTCQRARSCLAPPPHFSSHTKSFHRKKEFLFPQLVDPGKPPPEGIYAELKRNNAEECLGT